MTDLSRDCSRRIHKKMAECEEEQHVNNEIVGLIPLQLNYGGFEFTVNVDEEEANKILNDQEYASSYSKMLVDQMGERSTLGVPSDLVVLEDTECRHTPSTSKESSIQADETDKTSGTGFKWTHATILLLIETRCSMISDFQSAKRKRKLWEKIADIISRTAGVPIDWDTCDIKWRNLQGTYRRIRDKLKDSGVNDISWEYFEIMDTHLHSHPNSSPPSERLQSSMATKTVLSPEIPVSTKKTPQETTIHVDKSSSVAEASCIKTFNTRELTKRIKGDKKNLAPDWFLKYCEDRKKEREKETEELALERQLQEKRWQEQKQIEMMKIDIFKEFVAVIRK